MRTKTLALSTMLGALGTASLVAQTNVYSINAVGYINLVLPTGYSIIANQLTTTNNTLGGIFPNPTGQWNHCNVLKYSTATSTYSQTDGGQSSSYSPGLNPGWVNGGTMTMNPGEAIWFNNGTGSVQTNTIVGTVPQGTNTVAIVGGYQMISSPVPFSGDLVTNMGFTTYIIKSSVLTFNNPGNHQYTQYASSSSGTTGYMNQWVGGPTNPGAGPGSPKLNVGQGFWYKSAGSPGPNPAWVQIFSINP
jgi:hypothetical protein